MVILLSSVAIPEVIDASSRLLHPRYVNPVSLRGTLSEQRLP